MRRFFRDWISSDSLIFRAGVSRRDSREPKTRIWINNLYGLSAAAHHDRFQADGEFLVPERG
jgi:hypothetical protein